MTMRRGMSAIVAPGADGGKDAHPTISAAGAPGAPDVEGRLNHRGGGSVVPRRACGVTRGCGTRRACVVFPWRRGRGAPTAAGRRRHRARSVTVLAPLSAHMAEKGAGA